MRNPYVMLVGQATNHYLTPLDMKHLKITAAFLLLMAWLALCSYSYMYRRIVVTLFAPENTVSFRYTTRRAEFNIREEVSWKTGERKYATIEAHFNRYRQCHPTTADTVLYRTFRKDAWQFWNWFAFFTHPRYKLPYIDPATVPQSPRTIPPGICPEEG